MNIDGFGNNQSMEELARQLEELSKQEIDISDELALNEGEIDTEDILQSEFQISDQEIQNESQKIQNESQEIEKQCPTFERELDNLKLSGKELHYFVEDDSIPAEPGKVNLKRAQTEEDFGKQVQAIGIKGEGPRHIVKGSKLEAARNRDPHLIILVEGKQIKNWRLSISAEAAGFLFSASKGHLIAQRILKDMQEEAKKRADRRNDERNAEERIHFIENQNSKQKIERVKEDVNIRRIRDIAKIIQEAVRERMKNENDIRQWVHSHSLKKQSDKANQEAQKTFEIITDQVKKIINRETDVHDAIISNEKKTDHTIVLTQTANLNGQEIDIGIKSITGMRIFQRKTIDTNNNATEMRNHTVHRIHNSAHIVYPLYSRKAA